MKDSLGSGHCWGPIEFVRGLPGYGTTCANIDLALTIAKHPETSPTEKVSAVAYIATEGTAHIALGVGAGMLLWEAGAAASAAIGGTEAATATGSASTAACSDGDCTNEVRTGINVVY